MTSEQIRAALKAALPPEEFRRKYLSQPLPEQPETSPPAPTLADRLRLGAELRALEIQVQWILAALIPAQAVILFFGRGGLGKSTLAIMLLGAIAAGREIFNRQAQQRTAIYVDFENSLAVLSERLRHVCADDVLFLDSSQNPPRLDKPERRQYLELLAQHPGAVFLFDTLRSSQSGDENDSQSMTDIMTFLRQLRDAGATVIVLHHTPKSSERKYKGSGAIFDLCDHVLALYPVRAPGDEREADDDDEDTEARVFRFGTSQKTRYEPDRIFLAFNSESRCFVPAPDPAAAQMQTIADSIQAIHDRGEVANQKRILDELAGEIPKHKVFGILKRGEGVFWTTEKGLRGALLYTPKRPFQDSNPIYSWNSGKVEPANQARPAPDGQPPLDSQAQATGNANHSTFPDHSNSPENVGISEHETIVLTEADFEEVES